MKKIRILLFVIFVLIILMSINVNSAFVINDSNELLNAFKNDNLVRLHVIANSNSPKDQYIKRLIRNRVIEYISDYVGKEDYDLNNKTDDMKRYIESILERENIYYNSEIELGLYYFPARTYDDLTLPAGRYRALKIVLGNGEGTNWWCVLLPPMCIENKEMENSNSNKIEFRSKILDWLRDINDCDKQKNKIMDKKNIDIEPELGILSSNIKSGLNEEEIFKDYIFLNNYKNFKIIDDNMNLILR